MLLLLEKALFKCVCSVLNLLIKRSACQFNYILNSPLLFRVKVTMKLKGSRSLLLYNRFLPFNVPIQS